MYGLSVIIIRAFAAWLAVVSLQYTWALHYWFSGWNNADENTVWYSTTLFLLYGTLAVIAWFWAPRIAASYDKEKPDTTKEQTADMDDLAIITAGSFLIGLYILPHFVPAAIISATQLSWQNPNSTAEYLVFVTELLPVVFALWLIVGSKQVVRLYQYLRRIHT